MRRRVHWWGAGGACRHPSHSRRCYTQVQLREGKNSGTRLRLITFPLQTSELFLENFSLSSLFPVLDGTTKSTVYDSRPKLSIMLSACPLGFRELRLRLEGLHLLGPKLFPQIWVPQLCVHVSSLILLHTCPSFITSPLLLTY